MEVVTLGGTMNFSVEVISFIGMWIAQIFYVLCYIPQLVFNYKNKTGHGLSDFMLLGYLNGLIAFTYYVYLCNLPFIYKISAQLQIVAIFILVFQRLFYDHSRKVYFYRILYTSNVIGALFFLPIAMKNPQEAGCISGWLMFSLACVNQLPQVIKIYREKSVSGFSILFAIFTFVAAVIEFITSWILGLPVQTLVTALRAVIISLIWLVQFRVYVK